MTRLAIKPQQIIGLLVRVSTARQLGNARSEAQTDMGPYIEKLGFGVRYYDEGAISGSKLDARATTLAMLDDLQHGDIAGIAAYDVKRMTRDEFGIDGAIIAKRSIDAGGLIVTFGKTYDLRNEDDLLHFQFQCMLAGIDWRSIRNTFWSGIFKRLEHSPMFTRPPLGYMTEAIPTERSNVVLKRPAKNPEHAAVMAALAEAFEECGSYGEVARRLRNKGFPRPPVTYRGEATSEWNIQTLRYILTNNKIYEGVFELGGNKRKNGKPRSVVWYKFARDDNGNYRVFRHDVPEFAYWTPVQARRWREKFKTTQTEPRIRMRTHVHPLLGALVCEACGSPMIGCGTNGYVCRKHRSSGCDRPQKLSEHIVLALLRTIVADALSDVSDLAERIEQELAAPGPSPKARQLIYLEERSERLAKDYARMDESNEAMLRELSQVQKDINALREEVAGEAEERETTEKIHATLQVLRNQPLAAFEALDPGEQGRVYALLFRKVRIGYSGRATARRWWLASFESKFARGRVDVLHSPVVRVLPWAISGRLGLPSLQIDMLEDEVRLVNSVSVDSDDKISAYICSLGVLSSALALSA